MEGNVFLVYLVKLDFGNQCFLEQSVYHVQEKQLIYLIIKAIANFPFAILIN